MYAKRNSLTILAFLLLLSGVGFFWYRSEASEMARVSEKNKSLSNQLRGALEIADALTKVTKERDGLFRKWEKAPKKILNTEEPAFSLSYINWLIRMNNLDLDFDFYLNEKKTRKEYTAFSYTLNGEGDYRNICALVWHMTNNSLLYRIKNVTLKRNDENRERVNFVILFEGYSVNKDWEISSEMTMASQPFDWATQFGYDAFVSPVPFERKPEPKAEAAPRPVAATPVRPPKLQEPAGLFDTDGATLLAITNEKAYLRAKDGKVVPLKIGDQVRRGKLTRVDPRNNQVEFTLETESGSSRLLQLNIEYN
jgi:hypothetical protein